MNTNNLQYFPPRKQQGFAETCQANAIAAACQMLKIRGGYPDEDLSRMYLFDLSAVHEGLPVGSKAALESLFWVGETLGIPPESLYPYNDGANYSTPSPEVNAAAALQKINRSYDIPVDPYNPTATFTALKAAMAQGHSVVMSFKQRQWFALYLTGPEEGMLAIGAAVTPGSSDDAHINNHCVVIADVYDDFMGQGQAMGIVNSIGNGINEREVQIVSPRFLLDAINLRAVCGFAQATDRFSYDAEGIPGQVYRLYRAAFDRTPDKGGLGYHVDDMARGITLAEVAAQFVASPEFSTKYGALSNRAFVMQLYLNVLHRAGDAGGIDFHTANLDSMALGRHDTLVSFSASSEYRPTVVSLFKNTGVAYT